MPHPIDRTISSIRKLLLHRGSGTSSTQSNDEPLHLNEDDLKTISLNPVMTETFCTRFAREIQDPEGKELLLSVLEHMLIHARSDASRIEDHREVIDRYAARPAIGLFAAGIVAFLVGSVATATVPIIGAGVLLFGSGLSTGLAVYGRNILSARLRTASSEADRLEFLIKRLGKATSGGPNGTV